MEFKETSLSHNVTFLQNFGIYEQITETIITNAGCMS